MNPHLRTLMLTAAAVATATPVTAFAAPAKPTNAQKMQEQAMTEIPHCARKLGTLSITNGDDPRGWNQYNLAPPEKLLKVIVQRSGCFSLVDRGAGLNAAATERDIGGDLGLQRGSNVGKCTGAEPVTPIPRFTRIALPCQPMLSGRIAQPTI